MKRETKAGYNTKCDHFSDEFFNLTHDPVLCITLKQRGSVRRQITGFVFLSILGYCGIVFGGVFTTNLSGLPSISALLAESEDLTILFFVFMVLYIIVRTYLLVHYTNTLFIHPGPRVLRKNPNTADRYDTLYYMSCAFTVLFVTQVTCILLVGAVKITTRPTEHYVLAILGICATLIMETILFAHRYLIFTLLEELIENELGEDENDHLGNPTKMLNHLFGFAKWRVLLYSNMFLILCVGVVGTVYATVNIVHTRAELFIPISLAEYVLYALIVFLPSFHILDVRVISSPQLDNRIEQL